MSEIKVLNTSKVTTASGILNFDDIALFTKEIKGYGKFTLRIPTMFEETKISIAIQEATKGQKLSNEDKSMIEAIITLENVLTGRPEGFPVSMDEVRDIELIADLWTWCLECYREYNEGIKKKKENLKN